MDAKAVVAMLEQAELGARAMWEHVILSDDDLTEEARSRIAADLLTSKLSDEMREDAVLLFIYHQIDDAELQMEPPDFDAESFGYIERWVHRMFPGR